MTTTTTMAIEEEKEEVVVVLGLSNNTEHWVCDKDYIPTVREYSEELGGYHTALVVVGTILTLVLYGLFFEQVYFIHINVNKVFRMHVIWITSVYPFMTLMSLMSILIPRADTVCNAVKVTYMCIGMSHFTDLTTLMFGSEKVMLWRLQESTFTLNTGPLCCVCPCLPSPPVSKERLRWVRWMLWQMPYTQAFYFILGVLWATADSKSDGMIDPNTKYLWMNIINIVSFVAGVYALGILDALCREHLQHYSYNRKAFAVKILVLVTKLQGFVLDLLSLFEAFPCLSVFIAPGVYKLTLENTFYLVEMMILGPYSYWQYRNLQLLAKNPREVSYYTQTQAARGFRIQPEPTGEIRKQQSESAEEFRKQQSEPVGDFKNHQSEAAENFRNQSGAEGNFRNQSGAEGNFRNQSGAEGNFRNQSEAHHHHQLTALRGPGGGGEGGGEGYIGPAAYNTSETFSEDQHQQHQQRRDDSVHLNISSVFPSL
ncbi:hypothetical protein Pmani_033294 [Petrolisthes manimaculis]|uniref:Uncharacterized protein n=1 Tax=Petrolisthes manimaculis TaxID=1843537 RepID=A0AAE1NPW6_9EUCA|nr:hypothetical protein Pmani_033294 [Petrolisthes manimaculis]